MAVDTLGSCFRIIEKRLAIIEQKIGISNSDEIVKQEKKSQTRSNTTLKNSDVDETLKAGNWLAIVAVICFVFAAGFIIKLSIDSGWLTPLKQVSIAAVFGFALIYLGHAFLNISTGYISYLPATGIIILYLSAFSANRIYDLLSIPQTLLITAIISASCIRLYLTFKHDIYAITAAVGAYLAPIIVNDALAFNSLFDLYYILCCSITFAIISIWVNSRINAIVSAYLAILVTSVTGFHLQNNLMIALFLAAHFTIFSVSTYGYSLHNDKKLTETEAWSFFPVLILFYAMEYYFIDLINPLLAPWLSLVFASFLVGLYLSAKHWFKQSHVNSQSMIATFLSIVIFHSFYLELLPTHLKPWTFIVILVVCAYLPRKLFLKKQNNMLTLPILFVLYVLGSEYIHIISSLLFNTQSMHLPIALCAFLSIGLFFNQKQSEIVTETEHGMTILTAAHGLAICGLYRLTDYYGSLVVSASWLFYGLAIISFAYHKKESLLAKSAMLVLALAAGKALLYDAASIPTVARISCLLLTGIILYGAGFLMKKIEKWG